MNFIALFQQVFCRQNNLPSAPAGVAPSEERLPWANNAGDVLVVLFTVAAVLLLFGAVAVTAGLHRGWLAALAPAGLLLVFSEAFIRRRKNALAAAVYPALTGYFLLTAAQAVLSTGWLSMPVTISVLSALWAMTGLFFWQRYQAPSAVSQVVTGLVVATVVSPVVHFISHAGGLRQAGWVLYLVAFGFGALCAWLGMRFDQRDVQRTEVYSRIAFWFHSKGALGLTLALSLPYLGTSRWMAIQAASTSGIEMVTGALCTLVGAGAVLLSLRWNRKYYLWAGASLLTLGLLRVVPFHPMWTALGVLLALSTVLYAWDALSRKVRRPAAI